MYTILLFMRNGVLTEHRKNVSGTNTTNIKIDNVT